MSPERARAYRRVIKTLDDVGPTKLLDPEQELIRTTADTLIFSREIGEARAAVAEVEGLFSDLVASGRWHPVTAERLLADLTACGPLQPAALQAA